jgi:serine/threonine-protein kinase
MEAELEMGGMSGTGSSSGVSVGGVEPYTAPVAPAALQFLDDEDRIARLTGGRHEVLDLLGRGGMSRVYLAWDRALHRRVAVKLLDDGLGASVEHRERFRRETLIAAQLEHPHIVPCYDSVHRPDVALAVMRYVPGRSLNELTAEGQALPWRRVLSWLIPMADALAHAHDRGVIHRDVKPANILLQDEDGWPFLTDFGIATLRTSDASRAEVIERFGTPEFMAPEQMLGAWDADHRADIYSLGLTGYVALAGRLPFEVRTPVGMAAHRVALDPTPLRDVAPQVPARLASAIDKCLEREPRRRWRNASRLRAVLMRIAR